MLEVVVGPLNVFATALNEPWIEGFLLFRDDLMKCFNQQIRRVQFLRQTDNELVEV